MKGITMMKKCLLIGVSLLTLISNAAYETTPDGLTWRYELQDGKAIIVCREESVARGTYPNITYYTVYTASISTNTTGAVTIPETLGGCPVVSLGHDAMKDCSKITSLTLPNSITNIGTWTWIGAEPRKGGAFARCSGIRDIYIDNLRMLYNGISFQNTADNPFADAPYANLHVAGVLTTEAIIEAGVTDIGNSAFYNWRGLERVIIPDSVTNIGEFAFSKCTELNEIELPSNLKNIAKSAFDGCIGLMAIELPLNLTSIGESAFAGCYNIAHVSIPSSVTTIGEGAFSGCGRNHGLSLELPKFQYGQQMSRIVSVSHVTNLIFAADVDVLPYGVSIFTNLVSIALPPSITYISPSTFDNCKRLKAEWTKTVANLSAKGIGMEARYDLSDYVADRSIASVVVGGDSSIDEFVLVDGKVYDAAIRIVNTAANAVHITLPEGYFYESFLGAAPLTLPAKSTNMLTITRTGDKTFLVARRQLQVIAQ